MLKPDAKHKKYFDDTNMVLQDPAEHLESSDIPQEEPENCRGRGSIESRHKVRSLHSRSLSSAMASHGMHTYHSNSTVGSKGNSKIGSGLKVGATNYTQKFLGLGMNQ